MDYRKVSSARVLNINKITMNKKIGMTSDVIKHTSVLFFHGAVKLFLEK
jgi:hypothetical protein